MNEVLLDYFTIDGAFGGNQDWFTNIVMHIGGCAAATACDSCIYFAKHMGMEALYPYDINRLSKEDYKSFSQVMKPYIRPRVNGVKKLEWYIDGFGRYLAFLVAGYEDADGDFCIIAATYGEKVRLPLRELWDTGYEEKGGLILYVMAGINGITSDV